MSTILGIISDVSLIIVIYRAYQAGGETLHGYGFTAVLAMIFSLIGFGLGVVTLRNKNYYRLFPVLGVLFNGAALGVVALILQLAQSA